MWKLWDLRPNPDWKLSGFYADKKGYHNTVRHNQTDWPGNYSIRLELDLKHGNLDKERAIDITMSTSEMIKWTKSMKESALDPRDDRLRAVREFYGTLDGKTVYGLIKDDEDGPWRVSEADDTHLWHGHTSIFSAFVNNWVVLSPLLSVWSHETFDDWNGQVMIAKGDSGEDVKYWQYVHNWVYATSPGIPEIDVDGEYGPATVAAFTAFAKANGSGADYVANRMTGWLATKYMSVMMKFIAAKTVPVIPTSPQIPNDVLKGFVDDWMKAHLLGSLKMVGDFKGSIQL